MLASNVHRQGVSDCLENHYVLLGEMLIRSRAGREDSVGLLVAISRGEGNTQNTQSPRFVKQRGPNEPLLHAEVIHNGWFPSKERVTCLGVCCRWNDGLPDDSRLPSGSCPNQ